MKLMKAPGNDEPADIARAEALAGDLENFNAGAGERLTISLKDRAALQELRDAGNALLASLTDFGESRSQLSEITAALKKYAEMTTGCQRVAIGTESIEVPAIESAGIRAHLKREGTRIVDSIRGYVADRRAAMKRTADRQRAADERLAAAQNMPVLGSLLTACRELHELRQRVQTKLDGVEMDIRFEGLANVLESAVASAADIQSRHLPPAQDTGGENLVGTLIRQQKQRRAAVVA